MLVLALIHLAVQNFCRVTVRGRCNKTSVLFYTCLLPCWPIYLNHYSHPPNTASTPTSTSTTALPTIVAMADTTHTPSPALDHNHPRFQELLKGLFLKYPTNSHRNKDWDPVPRNEHSIFLAENVYLGSSPEIPQEPLNNPIHPIFDSVNWIDGPHSPNNEAFLNAAKPAFRLASLFLTDPSMSKFFAHMLYGVPSYNAEGRVYLAHSYREYQESAYDDLQVELLAVAEKVKFVFEPSEVIKGFAGCCYHSLQHLAKTLEWRLQKRFQKGLEKKLDRTTIGSNPVWYNPWPL
jgi:hypothetical protein